MSHIANVDRTSPSGASRRRTRARPGTLTRSTRAYSSAYRDERVQQTRQRILDALVRTMAQGVADVTMPAVAADAGVSVPTVYRHFSTKRELVAALGSHLLDQTGLAPSTPPEDLSGMEDMARQVFRRYDEMDLTIRAAMASQLGNVIRRDKMPERLAYFRRAISASAPDLDETTLDLMTHVFVLLFSTATMRAFKDYFGFSSDLAATHVSWAMRMLVQGAEAEQAKG